jgi:hypothetical protein
MFKFKYFILKKIIKAKRHFKSIKNGLSSELTTSDDTLMQNKSIKLWKLLLKDNDSFISCSPINRIRQIEKDSLLITLTPVNQVDYQMVILDANEEKSSLYEIHQSQKSLLELITSFDNENERRMMIGRTRRISQINNDLDKLLKKQGNVPTKQKNDQP